jgi:hypothetical protein
MIGCMHPEPQEVKMTDEVVLEAISERYMNRGKIIRLRVALSVCLCGLILLFFYR